MYKKMCFNILKTEAMVHREPKQSGTLTCDIHIAEEAGTENELSTKPSAWYICERKSLCAQRVSAIVSCDYENCR